MKNKGAKSRCFVCFRPVESGSGGQKKVSGGNPKSSARVTYISVSGDDLKPKILQPEKPDAPEAVDGSRSKRARGNLSRIIKSVVSESLSHRDGKVTGESNRETSVSIPIQNPSEIPGKKSASETLRKSSSDLERRIKSSSISSSSSRSSSPSSASAKRCGNYNPATVLCLLVVSLSVLVLWGRVCAIVWTSTWLYFVPRNADETKKLPQSEYNYKKKNVVTEGLLCRNRRCLNLSRRQ